MEEKLTFLWHRRRQQKRKLSDLGANRYLELAKGKGNN
jgi:hypothetical protein